MAQWGAIGKRIPAGLKIQPGTMLKMKVKIHVKRHPLFLLKRGLFLYNQAPRPYTHSTRFTS